ncbi:glycerophosphodiester phosphodiesterase domain-containing protein 1-like [Tropilaelaps mercedesae]|uniref:Glycerophosphodiester phosphodiesterase domain-containing protein 1-like n=1 Tax=Tropilaelaps mercedesae TaxID=418985 RepID=A0A1V9XZA4_9ACAR|nr:glycerophosphodiester phosphodiesterase domain-containing protein 1-like [Tropilaelaps mercedesae]
MAEPENVLSGGLSYFYVWLVLGAYALSSIILLKNPTLLHRKKKPKFTCVHISHRGGAFERLENTLEAFEHAVHECNTDMLEIDVHLTLDKQVVVAHDLSLLRTTGVDKDINQLCYKDLPPLRSSLDVEFMDGMPCAQMHEGVDRQIPLLKSVFERFPNVAINIDIKDNDDELIEKVHDLIEKFNRKEITVWGNVSYVVTQKCYNRDPSIPIFFSALRVAWLAFLAWTGLLPFVPVRETCLAVLHPVSMERNSEFKESAASNPAYWVALKAIDLILMRPFIVDHLRKRGIQVFFWVFNDQQGYSCGYKLGATGVMTDCPSLLKAYLQKNPHIIASRKRDANND